MLEEKALRNSIYRSAYTVTCILMMIANATQNEP